jgi:uncharacterized membrane-anchored protein
LISKKEIQKARNKWLIRVTLSFFFVGVMMFGMAMIETYYCLPQIYFKISFLILGIFYLYQMYSYRRIKCPNCGKPLLTSYGLYTPVPEECRRCKTKIE